MSTISVFGPGSENTTVVRIKQVLGEAPQRDPNGLGSTAANTPGYDAFAGLPPVSKHVADLKELEGKKFVVVQAAMGRGSGWRYLRMLPKKDLEATLRYDHDEDPILEHNGKRFYVKVDTKHSF